MKNDKNLAADLQKYLNEHGNDSAFWCRDSIGKIIQRFCRGKDNFKKARSGNPKKAFQKMEETIARKNGWNPEDENDFPE